MPETVLIIINELAGGLSAKTVHKSLKEATEPYQHTGHYQFEWLITSSFEELDLKIGEVCPKQGQCPWNRVITAGGDGTVIHVIAALMAAQLHIPLGIIPVGTGNRLASNLGLPTHIKGALEVALEGKPYLMDIGRINDRYFALMAGAGLDAEIMDKVHPLEKKAMGIFAYFWQGVIRAFWTPYAIFDIDADGHRYKFRGIGVVVANAGSLLGPYFTLTPGAKTNDGLFDICVLGSQSRMDYIPALIQILSQQKQGIQAKGLSHIRAKHITIKSRPHLKAQADGDVIGSTPLDIELLPKAVTTMIPKSPKSMTEKLTDPLWGLSEHVRLLVGDLIQSLFGL